MLNWLGCKNVLRITSVLPNKVGLLVYMKHKPNEEDPCNQSVDKAGIENEQMDEEIFSVNLLTLLICIWCIFILFMELSRAKTLPLKYIFLLR